MKAAMVRRNVLTVVGAAAMGLAMVMPAFAQDTGSSEAELSATVTAGFLTFTDVSVTSFQSTTIDGSSKTPTGVLGAFSVSDYRGSGAGWTVGVEAAPVANVANDHELGSGSLSMAAPDGVTPAAGTTSPAPSLTQGVHDIDVEGGQVFATAEADEGMGTYNFGTSALALELPSDMYAGTYESTLTITVQTPVEP